MTQNIPAARSLDKLHRARLTEIRKANQFFAYPRDIHEKDGFNPRDYEREDIKAHIRSLADAYKAGHYVPPITVKVVDGTIFLVDGHCRRRGMLLAISEGADLGQQPLLEFKGDEVEADALVITSQSGAKLTPVELASMYNRMINRGRSETEIASMVGKTVQHVKFTLDLHAMPEKLKTLISNNQVSATMARELFNEHGTAAVEMVTQELESAEKNGKNKVMPKAMNKSADRIPAKVARTMRDHLCYFGKKLREEATRHDDGSLLLKLEPDVVEKLQALLVQFESAPEQEGLNVHPERPRDMAAQALPPGD